MRLRALGLVALGIAASQPAFAHDIGKKFIAEYRKAYPADQWELMGRTVKTGNTVRVFFKRSSENVLRTSMCTRLHKRDHWICEAGQNLPEGSLLIK